MRKINHVIEFSASDISNHLACKYVTLLDLEVVAGIRAEPVYRDPSLAILQERGQEFELKYLDFFRQQGLQISEPGGPYTGIDRTIWAMETGFDVIYQADLGRGMWRGRADFLIKVERPGSFWPWSYEVVDTKLARETKGGTVLQLSLYTQLLEELQGLKPELMTVITPEVGFTGVVYRVDDFQAFFRLIKRRLLGAVAPEANVAELYPNPVPHCDTCRWWGVCNQQRHDDDHLSLIAGMSGSQTIELKNCGVATLAGYAVVPLPLEFRPNRGALASFTRLREQARVQYESRLSGSPVFELLDLDLGKGFFKLPEPSPGDIFFDLEGDPFADPGGLEYLFGWSTADGSYDSLWAFSETEEKAAFEQFIDWIVARRQEFPGLHIYHFGIYEETALKKLMGKYATREIEVDILLRGGILIDLHRVIRQALRAGIEKYSLKDLEAFYGFERKLDLRTASQELRTVERVIERSIRADIPESTLDAVKIYNKDDCVSTLWLRNWLEQLRAKAIDEGAELSRPESLSGVASEELNEKQHVMLALYNKLTADIPIETSERNAEQQARFLLANMLDWYWREKKAAFWEYYRLKEMPDDELLEEKAAISGLYFTGPRVPDKKSFIDRYGFPAQEFDIRPGDKLKTGDGLDLGEAFFIDADNRIIDIRKGPKTEAIQPTSIFKHSIFMDQVKMDAIHRLANWVIANGIDAPGYCRAGRDLLLCREPRSTSVPTAPSAQEVAIEWCQVLDKGVLPVQGPPGAGKSHSAAQMILRLVNSGKKIGITAMSHKVIVGLLEKVLKEARLNGITIGCIQKVSNISVETDPGITQTTDNKEILKKLMSGEAQIAAGTSWLWAREEMAGVLDVLFVDEAGQLSLIDTLVCAQAAHNLVLLGDPQQLKQPQQGSHPDGTEVSALEHLLKDEKTISAEKGVFLDETWRMHPNICAFISELFYESRLRSRADCMNQMLKGNTVFAGAGLSFVPVNHEGNQNCSVEESTKVNEMVKDLIKGDVFWTNKNKVQKPLELGDILIIAPYNAQVAELISKLPAGARVGTVDKFQGQEAPVVIFSMSTSTPAEAPRGMEFLYSLNRLNVAVSRAQAASIIVANPNLFEPDCRMPSQMKLANGFCRYLEMATTIIYD